ncbi:hypothetical protein M0208_14220 [Sphingomonas sp. SUN019]|uniref:hypothetical protein n=1 Tax=Sphingomonas sp. SUN019 TaxID=2937788 RepID=UPI0021642D32|nr:hypothetical protein [Sphingomonas sp. SUN019]UVO51602.1 hypothetical protein M0208_14220 [Sphingomonas sp. SUN019]
MSGFDLVFAFVSLLLGLAITEVLSGFSRTLAYRRNARDEARPGWLTPLLGLFVVLDLTSFWLLAFDFRNQLQANFLTLFGILTICGTYYMVATLVFPAEPGEWRDLDDFYDRQHRLVIGGVLAANLMQIAGQIAVENLIPDPVDSAPMSDAAAILAGVSGIGILALLIALLFIARRRLNIAMLMTANLLLLISSSADVLL